MAESEGANLMRVVKRLKDQIASIFRYAGFKIDCRVR